MRSLRIFLFLFFVLFVFNANALTTSQRNYLINEKGYTAQQISDYEARIEQREADRRAGRTPSPLTEEDSRILNDANTPEAIQYGNEPTIPERVMSHLGNTQGAANYDSSLSTYDRISATFYSIGNGSWFSPVFNMLFNSTNSLVAQVNTNLSGQIITILTLLLAFYILFTVTKAVVSFSPIEPSKLFSEIFCKISSVIFSNLPVLSTFSNAASSSRNAVCSMAFFPTLYSRMTFTL